MFSPGVFMYMMVTLAGIYSTKETYRAHFLTYNICLFNSHKNLEDSWLVASNNRFYIHLLKEVHIQYLQCKNRQETKNLEKNLNAFVCFLTQFSVSCSVIINIESTFFEHFLWERKDMKETFLHTFQEYVKSPPYLEHLELLEVQDHPLDQHLLANQDYPA